MRRSRKVAASGFYHVVSKGEADDILFTDDADRMSYLKLLAKACNEFDLKLRAYCLMTNHVHLLIEDPKGNLSVAMKRLNEAYAELFKKKTGRTGHVFKNRFWSEPVENDEYLLCAMRYIHANPAVAGICPASAYPWSSARDYLGHEGIADTALLLDMLGGRDGFIDFSRKEPMTALPFPGSKMKSHLSNDEIQRVVASVVGPHVSLRTLPVEERKEFVLPLANRGLNTSQIATSLALNYGVVRGILKSAA